MMMLIDQRVTDRSHSEGTMRIGIPMAMMSPCFQSMLLTNSLVTPAVVFASSDMLNYLMRDHM